MTVREELREVEGRWIAIVEAHPDDCSPEMLAIAAYLKARWRLIGEPLDA